MTRVALTAAMHNAIKSSFSFLLGFFPFIAARVLSHVEPLLHQSFTIVARCVSLVFLYLRRGSVVEKTSVFL